MTKKVASRRILVLIRASSRPLSTREISEKLKIAWHTADRYCLKLQLIGEIDCFTIGKATAWYDRNKVSDNARNSKRIFKHEKR